MLEVERVVDPPQGDAGPVAEEARVGGGRPQVIKRVVFFRLGVFARQNFKLFINLVETDVVWLGHRLLSRSGPSTGSLARADVCEGGILRLSRVVRCR